MSRRYHTTTVKYSIFKSKNKVLESGKPGHARGLSINNGGTDNAQEEGGREVQSAAQSAISFGG